eukprot:13310751-Alexandrium_andersonii.AAC.1
MHARTHTRKRAQARTHAGAHEHTQALTHARTRARAHAPTQSHTHTCARKSARMLFATAFAPAPDCSPRGARTHPRRHKQHSNTMHVLPKH